MEFPESTSPTNSSKESTRIKYHLVFFKSKLSVFFKSCKNCLINFVKHEANPLKCRMTMQQKLTVNQVEYQRRRKAGVFTFLHQAGKNILSLGGHGRQNFPSAFAWSQIGTWQSCRSPTWSCCVQLLKQ